MPPRNKPVLQIRTPPADHAMDMEAFVKGSDVQQPSSPAARQPGLPKRQRRQVTLYLPPELAKQLKLRAVELSREMSEIAEEAISGHLER